VEQPQENTMRRELLAHAIQLDPKSALAYANRGNHANGTCRRVAAVPAIRGR
jgi:hypothetical protein